MKARCALSIAVAMGAVTACEYHDRATELSLDHPCYVLAKGDTVAVRVQARVAPADGIDGVAIRWAVAPVLVPVTADPVESLTASANLDGFSSAGLAETVLALPDSATIALPASAVVTAMAASNDGVLWASSELRLVATGPSGACPVATSASQVDAPRP